MRDDPAFEEDDEIEERREARRYPPKDPAAFERRRRRAVEFYEQLVAEGGYKGRELEAWDRALNCYDLGDLPRDAREPKFDREALGALLDKEAQRRRG